MPGVPNKGVKDLYDYCCDGFFYEWVFPDDLIEPLDERYICMAPVRYSDAESLTLIEDRYDTHNEENSTWKITNFRSGTRDERLKHRPYKKFQLESDDDLQVVKCKIRPVIAIKKVASDWRIPGQTFYQLNTWLCLPLFTYKNRHTQHYVLNDQALNCSHRFYFPSGDPGLDDECAGKITQIQFIPENNLYLKKAFCSLQKYRMNLPFRLTEKAFKAVVGHISEFLPGIELYGESKVWYDFFKELVREEINKFLNN